MERREKLLNVCRTQWVLRLDGMGRVQEMIKPIILALEDIKDNHDGSYQADTCTDASGVYCTILLFDFVVNLIIVCNILSYITPIMTELQKVKLDILGVYDAVDNVVNTLQFCRDDADADRKHNKWLKDAVALASELDIPVKKPRVVRRQVHSENYSADTVSDYYKFSVAIPLLDMHELQSRFSPPHLIHGNGFFNVPSKVISTSEWKKYAH